MWVNYNRSRDKFNGHWTQKYKQSEVELGIMDTNIKLFLLAYGTPLMAGRPLHKYLGAPADTISAEKVLSIEYYLPVGFGEHVEVTLKIIHQVSYKLNSVELYISISNKGYTN